MNIYKGVLLVGTLAMLCSCGSESEQEATQESVGSIIRISSAAVNTTKGNYTSENLDGFGITIINSGYEDYTYRNVEVSGSNEDGWTPATTMYWRKNTDTVAIVAYAPYNSEAGIDHETDDYALSVKTNPTESDKSDDFLVWKDEEYVPKTDLVNGAIHIPLAHALSRIDLNITLMSMFNYLTLADMGGEGEEMVSVKNNMTDVYISGTITSGTCDFSQDTITASADASKEAENVYPYEIDGSYESSLNDYGEVEARKLAQAHYQCILMPQQADNFAVCLTIGSTTFKWDSGGLTLKGGKIYTIDIYVGGGADMQIGTKVWEAGGETDYSAEI